MLNPESVRSLLGVHRLPATTPLSRAVRLANRCGLEVKLWNRSELPFGVHNFDGAVLHVASTHACAASNVIHEVAHHMVASPSRKRVTNYGLGRAPDEHLGTARTDVRLTAPVAAREERYASALGVMIEHTFGFDVDETLCEHGWNPEPCATHPFDVFEDAGRMPPLTCRRCWKNLHRCANIGYTRACRYTS